jgi:hypothetical protein
MVMTSGDHGKALAFYALQQHSKIVRTQWKSLPENTFADDEAAERTVISRIYWHRNGVVSQCRWALGWHVPI